MGGDHGGPKTEISFGGRFVSSAFAACFAEVESSIFLAHFTIIPFLSRYVSPISHTDVLFQVGQSNARSGDIQQLYISDYSLISCLLVLMKSNLPS